MSIKFKEQNGHGIIELKDIDVSLANGFRRTLLSEIPTKAFDLSEIKKVNSPNIRLTNDSILFIRNIKFLNPFEKPEKNEVYHLAIQNDTKKYMPIFSDMIHTPQNKSADVQKGILLFYMPPLSKLEITNIKVKYDIENTKFGHVCHSPIIGNITYMPTDIYPVFYLNERGFIDPSPRFLPCKVIKKEIKYYTYNELFINEKDIIIYNEEYAKLMQSEARERVSKMEKAKADPKLFCDTRYFKSSNHVITFKAINNKATFEEAVKVLKKNIESAEYEEPMTDTISHIFSSYCFNELECPIYLNSEDNNAKITIINDNPQKLFETVKKKLIKILSI